MKTLRDYIDLVNQRFDQALSEKADPSKPASMKNINGMNVFTNDPQPANAVQSGTGGAVTSGSGAAVTSGTPAPAPDAAAAAKAKLTPSQLKWLGGADATDQYIMARMPKPLPGETVPGAAPAAAAAPVDDRNEMDKASDAAAAAAPTAADRDDAEMGAAMTANAQAATQAANGVDPATGQMVSMKDPATGQMINPENGLPVTPQTAAAPAVAQAGQAKPAAGGKVPPQPTLGGKPSTGPKGQAWLQKYGATHNPDGTPKTAGAPAAPAPAAPANPNGAGRDPTGAYRGDRTNPAPAARDPNGAYRGDRTNPAPTPIAPGQNARDDLLARKPAAPAPVAKEGRTDRNDHAFIDELNAMRSIAGLPTKNKW
jgi:hypothetical protein